MRRWWIRIVVPMTAVALLMMLRGLRSGRVEADPAPRAAVRTERAPVVAPAPRVTRDEVLPQDSPANVTSTAVEIIDSKVPHATARAVNSWFDFESALSDLSSCREVLGDETYRQEVLRMTSEFLELAPGRVPAFESTLRAVQADLRRIQRDMGQVLATHPIDLSDAELRRLQSEAESRFRPDRDAALARFESFLDSRPRHREFHGYLDLWVTRCCGLDP